MRQRQARLRCSIVQLRVKSCKYGGKRLFGVVGWFLPVNHQENRNNRQVQNPHYRDFSCEFKSHLRKIIGSAHDDHPR